MPVPDPHARDRAKLIQKEIYQVLLMPSGCRFHARCPYLRTRKREPQMQYIETEGLPSFPRFIKIDEEMKIMRKVKALTRRYDWFDRALKPGS